MDISFEELKRVADARGLDIHALKACTGACTSCGTCEPYVRLMLQTGRTRFPVLDQATCIHLMRATQQAAPRPPAPDDAAWAARLGNLRAEARKEQGRPRVADGPGWSRID